MPSNALPDPVVRFRLRTLLMVTTGLAVLAAIAGPYYRSVGPAAQSRLLIFWSVILVSVESSLYLRLRESFRRGEKSSVRFVVFAARQRPALVVVWTIGTALWIAVVSFSLSDEATGRGLSRSPWFSGFMIGSAVAGLIFGFVRRPLFLCEAGIPLAHGVLVPWKYVRYADWLPEAKNVMKFRRYDGDIYIEVPAAIRDKVEAFIREKIGADVMTSANN